MQRLPLFGAGCWSGPAHRSFGSKCLGVSVARLVVRPERTSVDAGPSIPGCPNLAEVDSVVDRRVSLWIVANFACLSRHVVCQSTSYMPATLATWSRPGPVSCLRPHSSTRSTRRDGVSQISCAASRKQCPGSCPTPLGVQSNATKRNRRSSDLPSPALRSSSGPTNMQVGHTEASGGNV